MSRKKKPSKEEIIADMTSRMEIVCPPLKDDLRPIRERAAARKKILEGLADALIDLALARREHKRKEQAPHDPR